MNFDVSTTTARDFDVMLSNINIKCHTRKRFKEYGNPAWGFAVTHKHILKHNIEPLIV